MLGNLLAGTEESPGITMMRDGQKMKVARGMEPQEFNADLLSPRIALKLTPRLLMAMR